MQEGAQFYSIHSEDAAHLINAQIGTANYLVTPVTASKQTVHARVSTNEDLWKEVLRERYHAGTVLSLERFFLFEWFPRAPGLYFTPEGRTSRENARQFIRKVPVPRRTGTQQLDANRKDREFLDIYDPHGKISMLKGGVGCIRLKRRVLEGGRAWFVSASSNGVAHEGFPVAVPDHLFQRYIDLIKERGALRCTLQGELQFLPEESVVQLYKEYRGVPQLYLMVENIVPEGNQAHENLLVSAGISFLSSFEGLNRTYATYATFDAATRGSVSEIVDWLQDVYVQGLYNGRVVTDFDEQETRFAGATFSLHNVSNNQLDHQAASTVIQAMGLDANNLQKMFTSLTLINTLQVGRIERMDNKTVNIGAGATVSAPVVVADILQDSFNTLERSDAQPELKILLNRLLQTMADASRVSPSPDAENATRDAKNLVEEVTAKQPRPGEGRRLIDRVKQWAQTIGEVGKPIVELVTSIVPLLPH